MYLPPYSPDMNITENVWAMLKQKVRKDCFEFGRTGGRRDFESLVERKWEEIPIEVIENLYKSLPNRMKQILESEGTISKY